jgi:hypothetical protein
MDCVRQDAVRLELRDNRGHARIYLLFVGVQFDVCLLWGLKGSTDSREVGYFSGPGFCVEFFRVARFAYLNGRIDVEFN